MDEEHSICEVAARHGIFCHGYRQWSEEELRKRFRWIAGPRPHFTRTELEEVIDLYKLARQQALEVPLSCDAQEIDRDSCMGWDEFSDAALADFYKECFGGPVKVVAEPSAS